ncbi:WYL domain-containing protein [Otariodibacter sp.]|uniref:helix-turn-helix transcriptional regulator n=1 Tax=Otariodibacter sp. TaxID=3030919 RepID=UPI002607514F|nr:WYL domain-containing protein [Otariodibacter sp.]
MKKNQLLASRLSEILTILNSGERIDIHKLAEKFEVSIRTIQRDLFERLSLLEWKEAGPRYFQLDRSKLGIFDKEDIARFANFASIADLFPKIDREFFQNKLCESIKVKGFEYEDISKLEKEFNQLKTAISTHNYVHFNYTKSGEITGKFYKIAPYALINKNGIWYLIGTDKDKQKTFCFTQISLLKIEEETFEPNLKFIEEIKTNDSISHGNQIPEVIVQVSKTAAPYFLRRALLPNQQLLHKQEDGGLLLSCKDINEMEIVPLVQYWIPHLRIVSPEKLQHKMIEKIQQYLVNDR